MTQFTIRIRVYTGTQVVPDHSLACRENGIDIENGKITKLGSGLVNFQNLNHLNILSPHTVRPSHILKPY